MTDLELDTALALAIGYRQKDVHTYGGVVLVYTGNPGDKVHFQKHGNTVHNCRIFSHKDWNVAGPIAQVYKCFPAWETTTGKWLAYTPGNLLEFADTPQRAIAMAVIKGVGK